MSTRGRSRTWGMGSHRGKNSKVFKFMTYNVYVSWPLIFPPDSSFTHLIKTGTYKFIQNYASYCSSMLFTSSWCKMLFDYFFSSLPHLYKIMLAIVLQYSSLLLDLRCCSSISFSSLPRTFRPSPSLRLEVASASTKRFMAGKVL